MNMGSNTLLSDLIDACLGQNLPKDKLVYLFEESIETGHRMLDEDPCGAEVVSANSNQGLHIASFFIVLVASALGVAFPLMAKYNKKLNIHHYSVILGKCAGTGVILACALVHMIQPSNASLTSECVPTVFNTGYQAFAYLFALIAALSMHLLEFFLSSLLIGDEIDQVHEEDPDKNQVHEEDLDVNDSLQLAEKEKGRDLDDCHKLAITLEQERLNAKHISEAYMVEFGVAVHSVFIGLSVGVTDKDTLVALLVALVFHQMFEGVALGSRLSDTTLGLWNEVFLGSIFALSAPIGIAIGIGVFNTLNTNGQAFLLVQGVFDGICGGILLYTGFIFLIQDFTSDMALYCRGKHRRLMQAGMFIFLWVFACLMAFIGMFL